MNGMYSNFAEGEPDENGEEDDVGWRATGQWNDDGCASGASLASSSSTTRDRSSLPCILMMIKYAQF